MRHRFKQFNRRGASATELAILLPLLITLCLVSVDLGRFAFVSIALGNATRVGAEWGATHRYDTATAGTWNANLEAAILAEFTAEADIDPAQLETTVTTAEDDYDLLRVTVTATYPWNTIITWPMIPRPLMLEQRAVMRRFR
ncbi:TadE-like protein [Anatilimnocola aggregata]|uniref:TadE-like protein n=1 Tax=Anatilimnocola aggregata TaxID=2528021 RepID=A0A517YN51_9BACT|nr:TadE/TadG family type IV pilus assembly protein [Anatilimnocola aggregata]QDU31648.1 TadE-like protein [Anatilimnocola aggregata]